MQKKFKTLRKIGEGSFGTVFLVQGTDGMRYALKNIQINPFTREQSKEEVQALKILEHHNFIKIYDYLENEDTLQILTEFCDGSNLKTFCKENCGKLSVEDIKCLIDQIVEAAIYMNDKGIIHRDLKPQNILLSNQNGKHIIKICDLGCAKRSIISDISYEVQSSFEKGTTIYTSPQQLQNKSYSTKCDVWSMGCLLHELILGEHPYKSNNIDQMKELMKKSQMSSILKLSEETDPYLKYMLRICLKYNEQQRATWRELKLLKFFIENSQKIDQFLNYIFGIGSVGQWIFQEIWEGRKDLEITKDMKKAFIFFITGFLESLYSMIIGIMNKQPQFQHYFHNKQVNQDLNLLKEAKTRLEKYKSINEKISQHLQNNEKLKRLLRKIPSHRNSMIPNLEYTIKYGKKIIQQILSSKKSGVVFANSSILYVLAKWYKFQENFGLNRTLKANDLKKHESIRENNQIWIKQYLNLN